MQNEAFQDLKKDLKNIRKSISALEKEKMKAGWLTTEEVCDALHISKRTLQNYRDQNLIFYSQIGRKIIYRKEDIDEFLSNHKISKS